MSIFVDQTTRLVVQGITGRDGSFHSKQMLAHARSGQGVAGTGCRGEAPVAVAIGARAGAAFAGARIGGQVAIHHHDAGLAQFVAAQFGVAVVVG